MSIYLNTKNICIKVLSCYLTNVIIVIKENDYSLSQIIVMFFVSKVKQQVYIYRQSLVFIR